MIRQEELDKIPDINAKALHHVFENGMVKDNGIWLEFGVHGGGTINRISHYTDKNIIYGFDSFEGLPEDWTGRVEAHGGTYPKGTFSLGGWMPEVKPNVNLIKGWFINTLPAFISEHNEPVTFIHVDSDIYSSAKDIFFYLKSHISNGCIIAFDELIGYTGFELHEWKAWWEFVDYSGVTFEWIGGNTSGKIILPEGRRFDVDRPDGENVSPSHENVAVRIINNPLFNVCVE